MNHVAPHLDAFLKPFDPAETEPQLRAYWDQHKFYRGQRDPQKKAYTIVIPPPNVTGDLHMGHMLNNTLQDILIRWHRAAGFAACWIPGTDHASIATEAKVTAQLKELGIDKKKIGRDEFLKHAWKWKENYGGRIVHLLKSLGISCDWEREAFTMEENYSAGVIKAFVKLYKDGLVYKGHRLVNWCPASQSVISDEEVDFEERPGSLWYIKYGVVGMPQRFVTVATTRPETLFGDLAVAVHPDDERYKDLHGRQLIVPICGRSIPLICDTYCDMAMGTGAVKITPAHDMNDYAVGQRHKLGLLNVMNPDATLNDNVPEDYCSLDRFVARKKLVAELEKNGDLEKIEPYKLTIGISQRGQVPIEYYLSEQWYLKMEDLAASALDATRSKELILHPAHTEKIWEHWLTNIKDWCLSRQLWWGHRIPVYTCAQCGHVHCEEHAPTKCTSCGHGTLNQDPDVLDTWASSWLWPFAVHNWANPNQEQQQDLSYFYPTDVIVTGSDIIFFWIARMVMAGRYFMKKIPFKDVFFTPIVRDAKGRKMSKSLGNFPDTLGLMNKYGTDALRFALVNQIVPGQDINWADNSCEMGRHFANKIWNAVRFLLNHANNAKVNPADFCYEDLLNNKVTNKNTHTKTLEKWITSEFFACVEKAHQGISQFDFARYSSSCYEFMWMVFCDWFIEISKPTLHDAAQSDEARALLGHAFGILDGVLRLLHPLMPYVTEQIWLALGSNRGGKTVGNMPLPTPQKDLIDDRSIAVMRTIQDYVSAVRTIRGQSQIHPATQLIVHTSASEIEFAGFVEIMTFLTKAQFVFSSKPASLYSSAAIGSQKIYVEIQGLVDIQEEKIRLQKRIEKSRSLINVSQKKLQNPEFVKGAPPHILKGAQAQLEQAEQDLELALDGLNQFSDSARY